jgi:hypothetical protein
MGQNAFDLSVRKWRKSGAIIVSRSKPCKSSFLFTNFHVRSLTCPHTSEETIDETIIGSFGACVCFVGRGRGRRNARCEFRISNGERAPRRLNIHDGKYGYSARRDAWCEFGSFK